MDRTNGQLEKTIKIGYQDITIERDTSTFQKTIPIATANTNTVKIK